MLTAKESQLLAGVSADDGWPLVESFARTRRELPDEFERGAQQLVDRLHDLKLPVQVHKPSIYLGIPRSAKVVCEGVSYRCKATALSPQQESFSARLVHIPANDSASRLHTNDPVQLFGLTHESLRERIAGRVVVTEGLSNPGRSELFESLGARAAITINPGEAVHWGASSTVWGSPGLEDLQRLPRIASIAVNRTEGMHLAEAASRGAVVTIEAEVLHGWFMQTLPVVEIPGNGPHADEFVLLHGHLDSWDLGVGDNATGDAVLLEVAKALHARRETLERSVRIAWWPGHSAGRYAGSTWFADRHAHRLRSAAVAHLNCDSPGCAQASDYSSIRGMAEAEPLVSGAVKDLFGQTCRLERPGRAGDYSFNNLGITGAMLTSSMVPPEERKRRGWYAVGGNGGSPTWHTEDDVMAVADRQVLLNDARLYTLVAARLACQQTPQLDYRRPLAQIASRLAIAEKQAAGEVDLAPHRQLLSSVIERVDSAYCVEDSGAAAAKSWRSILKASRSIVRAGYAQRGPFEQDAAFAQPAVPMLEAAAQAAVNGAARVSLQRGANQLQGELQSALEALDQ